MTHSDKASPPPLAKPEPAAKLSDHALKNWQWAAICFAVLLIAGTALFLESPNSGKGLPLADISFSAGAEPGAPTELRSLPDNWRSTLSVPIEEGWYQATFEVKDPAASSWAIHLSSHRSNAALYVNDIFIGDGGRFEKPVARNTMRPLLIRIPQSALRPGQNTVKIRLVSDPPGHGYLGPVVIAPWRDLRTGYAIQRFFSVTLQEIATFLVAAFSAMLVILWLRRRSDRAYILFAGMTAAWTLHNLNSIVTEIPVPLRIWDPFIYLSLLWLVVCAVLFALDFTDQRKPRLERYLVLLALAISLSLAALPFDLFYKVANSALIPFELALGLYAVFLIATRALRTRDLPHRLLTLTGCVVILYAIHDALVVTNVLSDRIYYLLPYSEFLLIGTIGVILLDRFLKSVDAVDALNATLEARVIEKEQDLTRAFEVRGRLEQREILNQERQRLMREIHDGLGGHLVSILSLAEDDIKNGPHIQSVARSALNEMRLMVSSMGLDSSDLPTLMGTFREIVIAPLEANGLEVDWQVGPTPPIAGFGPRTAMHILRILQESVANAVRHTDLERLTLRLQTSKDANETDQTVDLSIVSEGNIKDRSAGSGRGLENIRARAQEIGASVTLTPAPAERSFTVCLHLPVAPPSA